MHTQNIIWPLFASTGEQLNKIPFSFFLKADNDIKDKVIKRYKMKNETMSLKPFLIPPPQVLLVN